MVAQRLVLEAADGDDGTDHLGSTYSDRGHDLSPYKARITVSWRTLGRTRPVAGGYRDHRRLGSRRFLAGVHVYRRDAFR